MNTYQPLVNDPRLERVFDLVSLCDAGGVLCFEFQCFGGEKLKISFDSYLAYRKMDEGDALLTLDEIASSNCSGRSIYLVRDSDFLRWFCEQAAGSRSCDGISHYAIHALNDIVDVLSIDPPVWEWSL